MKLGKLVGHLFVSLLMLLLGSAAPVLAHKASDAFLQLSSPVSGLATAGNAERVELKLSLALKDLDLALPALDANNDRQLQWGELKLATPQVIAWAAQGLSVRCAQEPLTIPWRFSSLERRTDGSYIRLEGEVTCPRSSAVAVEYGLMKDLDRSHRLIINSELNGTAGQAAFATVLSPSGKSAAVVRAAAAETGKNDKSAELPASGWQVMLQFFPEGMHHILGGPDHLAFLLALLLPMRLFSRQAEAKSPWVALIRTVTGFTIGHSVTLVLANLGWISASPAWVEPAIALSILFSAALNLRPVGWLRSDWLALAFGLVHGLGFSGVMLEANISGTALYWGLAGFNLGVEAGQLLVVAAWCLVCALIAYTMTPARRQTYVVKAGSWGLIALSMVWLVQRV